MKIKLNSFHLCGIKDVKRIESLESRVGNIDVFYAIYKADTDAGEIYAVAVGEGDSLSAVTLESEADAVGLYKTVSENEVGEVTFFDVYDDFLYEKQHFVI